MPRPLKGFQFIAPSMEIHRNRRDQNEWAETTGRDLLVDPRAQRAWSPQRRASVLVRQAADSARSLNVVANLSGDSACRDPNAPRYLVNAILHAARDLHDAGALSNEMPADDTRASVRDRIFAVNHAVGVAGERAVQNLMRCAIIPPNPYDD